MDAPKPLTVDWISKHCANLPQLPIASVTECPLTLDDNSEDEGVNSECSILMLSYGVGERDITYIVKRAGANLALDAAIFQRWFERECKFYKEVACQEPLSVVRSAVESQAPVHDMLKVPCCYAANWEPGSKSVETFILILERLTYPEWVRTDASVGCNMTQAVAAVRALGALHASFFDSGTLSELSWLPVMPVHQQYGAHVEKYYATCFAATRDHLKEFLCTQVFLACESLCHCYSSLLNRLAQPPLTLLHGDFRLENIRFSRASPLVVAAFDWQFVSSGRGAYDFAYFLALSSPPPDRRSRETRLLEAYLESFGGRLEKSEFEDDVRTALLLVLASFIMGVATATPSTHEMHQRSVRWLGEAIQDWNAANFLASL